MRVAVAQKTRGRGRVLVPVHTGRVRGFARRFVGHVLMLLAMQCEHFGNKGHFRALCERSLRKVVLCLHV